MVVWENSAKDISVEQCLKCQEQGLDVIVNDGRDITFEMELGDYDN